MFLLVNTTLFALLQNIEITFSDLFPVSIGAITMNTASSDVPIITCDLTFKYNHFKIKSPGNEIAS